METKEITVQQRFEFEVMYGKLVMHHKFRDLVMECLALCKLRDFTSVPLTVYIDTICRIDKYARKAKYDIDFVVRDSEDMIEELRKESDVKTLTEEWFYDKLCFIFDLYFVDKHFGENIMSEDLLPDYFPPRLKDFIKELYPLFQSVCQMQEGAEFIDLLEAHCNERVHDSTCVNRALILTKVFMGKIRSGRNITRLLYERIPQDIPIPDSFKKLCRVKNGKYIIFNTNWHSLDFKLAVLDLICFTDFNNKLLFNNKLNQFLKKHIKAEKDLCIAIENYNAIMP